MAYDKHTSDRLLASDRRKMRSTDFGIPETREEKKALLAHRILIKARKYGVHVRSEEILEWASKYSK